MNISINTPNRIVEWEKVPIGSVVRSVTNPEVVNVKLPNPYGQERRMMLFFSSPSMPILMFEDNRAPGKWEIIGTIEFKDN